MAVRRFPRIAHIGCGSALSSNRTLRELRLTGQKTGVSKSVEEALAALLDAGGATALCKLGLSFRNDAARRRVDATPFPAR